LGDFIESEDSPDPVDVVLDIVAKEGLTMVLESLDKRERKIVELRFGLKGEHPRTLAEVSSRFNVSRERIRQIEAKALERIKAELEIQATEDPT
jgi:RNA polymerase primary sigma factor